MTRMAACYHEAGHAVVALNYGMPVEALEVESDHSGMCTYGALEVTGITGTELVVAGPLCEALYLGRDDWVNLASNRGEHADLGGVHIAYLGEAVTHARRVLRWHWGAVDALATALHRAGALHAAEIQAIWQATKDRASTPSIKPHGGEAMTELSPEQFARIYKVFRVRTYDGVGFDVAAAHLGHAAELAAAVFAGSSGATPQRVRDRWARDTMRGTFSVQRSDGGWKQFEVTEDAWQTATPAHQRQWAAMVGQRRVAGATASPPASPSTTRAAAAPDRRAATDRRAYCEFCGEAFADPDGTAGPYCSDCAAGGGRFREQLQRMRRQAGVLQSSRYERRMM